jgi:hypothetical protein
MTSVGVCSYVVIYVESYIVDIRILVIFSGLESSNAREVCVF